PRRTRWCQVSRQVAGNPILLPVLRRSLRARFQDTPFTRRVNRHSYYALILTSISGLGDKRSVPPRNTLAAQDRGEGTMFTKGGQDRAAAHPEVVIPGEEADAGKRGSSARKVAVFVAHGMGQQVPFETMDTVAAGLKAIAERKNGPLAAPVR